MTLFTLQTIRFQDTKVCEFEDDLDKLIDKVSSLCLKQHRMVRLAVGRSKVSPGFWSKWSRPLEETGVILCTEEPTTRDNVADKSDDLSVEEINWLIQELENKHDDFGDTSTCQYPSSKKSVDNEEHSSQCSSAGEIDRKEESEKLAHDIPPNSQSELEEATSSGLLCSLIDKVHEGNEELSLEEINWLIQQQELNSNSKMKAEDEPPDEPSEENHKGMAYEDKPSDETLKGQKTEDPPPDETLKGKKTEDKPPDKKDPLNLICFCKH